MSTVKVLVDAPDTNDNLSPRNRIVAVELPDGYRRVWVGAVLPGDLYLDVQQAKEGAVRWVYVTKPAPGAHWYACLIRRGLASDPPCERCEVEARRFGLRYCRTCIRVLRQSRKEIQP